MIDRSRIFEIYAKPTLATPEEIQSLAETAHQYARESGQKTLRDEFAMAALPSVLAVCCTDPIPPKEAYSAYVARMTYALADAMLRERDPNP